MESKSIMNFRHQGYRLAITQRGERRFHWCAVPIRDGCPQMCGATENPDDARDRATKWAEEHQPASQP